jgi:hypothetical protein
MARPRRPSAAQREGADGIPYWGGGGTGARTGAGTGAWAGGGAGRRGPAGAWAPWADGPDRGRARPSPRTSRGPRLGCRCLRRLEVGALCDAGAREPQGAPGVGIDFRLIFAYLSSREKAMYMTRRQKEILDFLNRYIERKGYAPPSRRPPTTSACARSPPCTSTSPTSRRRAS